MTLELHAEDQVQLEKMTKASLAADDAAQAVEQAGAAAPSMLADLGRKRMLANRMRRSLETGEPAAAVVTLARRRRRRAAAGPT